MNRLSFFSFILITIAGCQLCVRAQSAMDSFQAAKSAADQGDIDASLGYLEQCESVLKSSNARIESLRIFCYFMKEEWIKAKIASNRYMKSALETERFSDAYREIEKMIKRIDLELEALEDEHLEEIQTEKEDKMAEAEETGHVLSIRLAARAKSIEDKNTRLVSEQVLKSRQKESLEFYEENYGDVEPDSRVSLELDKHKNPDKHIIDAAQKRNVKEVIYLAGLGGDINARNGSKESLLHIAVKNKDLELLTQLCRLGASKEIKGTFDETPMLSSIRSNYTAGAVFLLSLNVNPSATDAYGQSAIFHSIRNIMPVTLKKLIKAGADPNLVVPVNGERLTPLYFSVYHLKNAELVRILLDGGARVDEFNKKNWTPLMAAVFNNDEKMVKILLDNGADVKRVGPKTWTALHFAARENEYTIARMLIEAGANPDAEDIWSRTPLNVAKEHEHKELVKLLKGL